MKNENVLVVKSEFVKIFDNFSHFYCGFFETNKNELWAKLDCVPATFKPRIEVENDSNFKQLIPYVIFRWISPDGVIHVFSYKRGNGMGEKRLHLKYSLGIGGHVSDEDVSDVLENSDISESVYDILYAGLNRELKEEVIINTTGNLSPIGIIADDFDDVGKVHLGIVFIMDVVEPNIHHNEDDILESGFLPLGEINENCFKYERWSQNVLANQVLSKNL